MSGLVDQTVLLVLRVRRIAGYEALFTLYAIDHQRWRYSVVEATIRSHNRRKSGSCVIIPVGHDVVSIQGRMADHGESSVGVWNPALRLLRSD